MSEEVESDDGPKCPYCGYVDDDHTDWHDVVTYWGDQTVSYSCSNCDKDYNVQENVSHV